MSTVLSSVTYCYSIFDIVYSQLDVYLLKEINHKIEVYKTMIDTKIWEQTELSYNYAENFGVKFKLN